MEPVTAPLTCESQPSATATVCTACQTTMRTLTPKKTYRGPAALLICLHLLFRAQKI